MPARRGGRGRGFFAIGVYEPKTRSNVGMLLRSSWIFGAAFVFTIGKRYQFEHDDTPNTARHVPLFHYPSIVDCLTHLPHDTHLIGVELDGRALRLGPYSHLLRAAYLLGAEDYGLPEEVLVRCRHIVRVESPRSRSMNVAVAGSILMHDRYQKQLQRGNAMREDRDG